jgi:hypothetical protein
MLKKALFLGLGGYLAYNSCLDTLYTLEDWIPQWMAATGGEIIGQTVLVGILAMFAFGTVVWTGYRFLGYLLD